MVSMPHWPKILGKRDIRMELDGLRSLLQAMGNPHLKLPKTIHLAGTNGKGSTLSFIRTILEAHGYKVHAYTSPHLMRFNERIILHGEEISDEYLYELAEETKNIAEQFPDKPLTFFESTTAIAFLAFSRITADFLLLETGMGGRLDATNVISDPIATVITPISIDHTDYLGPNLQSIAREKAGIIKPNAPVIIAQQHEEVYEVLFEVADKNNAKTIAFEYDYIAEINDLNALNSFTYKDAQNLIEYIQPSLKGSHQFINAATAIATVVNLPAFTYDIELVKKGISTTYWIGRLEQITQGCIKSMLGDEFEIWVDGAHNQHGAESLSCWLNDTQNAKPLYMILGMTQGRDVKKFIANFQNLNPEIFAVLINAEPSSYAPEIIFNAANALGLKAQNLESLHDALMHIKSLPPGKLIITGSLYLAGETIYQNKGKRDKLIYC